MSLLHGIGAGLGGAGDSGGALGSSSIYSHTINQSLRLNRAESAHLYKTWGADADSNKIFTFSIWFKRRGAGDGSNEEVLVNSKNTGSGTGQGYTLLGFYRDSELFYYTQNGGNNGTSKALFRDPGAWMHLCWQYDTTQSTESNRIRFYINGVQNATTTDNWTVGGSSLYPAEDSVMTSMNQNGQLNAIGAGINNSVNFGYFDGYIAEVIMLDGITTDCTAFGEFVDGVWIPKSYSGSFGTNGYHLDFADSSAIGNDVSGNNNDWTSSGLAAHDVVPDSPTNNFAAFNPLIIYYNPSYPAVFSEGNLKVYRADNNWVTALSTLAVSSGKWYAEFVCTVGGNYIAMGILDIGAGNAVSSGFFIGEELNSVSYYGGNGYKYVSQGAGGSTTSYGSTFGIGDVIGVALDLDAGTVKFYKNNTVQASGTAAASSLSGTFAFGASVYGNNAIVANFGQDGSFANYLTGGNVGTQTDGNGIGAFKYAPPSDHLALCASNLPAITIGPGQDEQADDYFNTVLYTGDGDNDVTATNTFAADWVWLKNRTDSSTNHYVQDSVRGFGASKSLSTNAATIEGYNGGAPSSHNIVTGSTSLRLVSSDFATDAKNFVALTLKTCGSANTFNVDGTGYGSASDASLSGGNIAPTGASVSTTSGFSIIEYTGNGSANQTIKHGLSSAPEFIIIKDREANSNNGQWQVSSSAIGDDYGYLSLASPAFTGTGQMIPTSGDATTVTIGRDATVLTNETGDDFIMYCFNSVEGYQRIGVYTGNGAADGAFVYTGFRPAWVLIKGGTNNWSIYDNKRDIDNVVGEYLIPNNGDGAGTAATMDFVSNGFKLRTAGSYANQAVTFFYYAIAEAPFKFANAR